eukprot:TRINITY_DN24969_c0_g1_i1.p1 TRINITY_DN24969_c0_g1~~TRINITY_DN24969_c0_g1_i1.p1  ORF type:complete len:107 (-),score=22.70 TRINITY_DN24969_c0_g1_i1:34-354(-)
MYFKSVTILVFFFGVMLAVSAEVDSRVNFEGESTTGISVEKRQVTRCSKPCPRILRPVRGVQNGNVVLLPNMCEFRNAQCKASDARSGPLLLAEDQSNIQWPISQL